MTDMYVRQVSSFEFRFPGRFVSGILRYLPVKFLSPGFSAAIRYCSRLAAVAGTAAVQKMSSLLKVKDPKVTSSCFNLAYSRGIHADS